MATPACNLECTIPGCNSIAVYWGAYDRLILACGHPGPGRDLDAFPYPGFRYGLGSGPPA